MDVDVRRDYSPALDGLRGVAMVGFMAYHFGATVLTGAWTGINLFFVLSGFLIVRLLERERKRTGRVDLPAFYRRRARRLLPALLALLSAVAVWAIFFAAPGRRKVIGGDILATLGFVENWRLIALEDRYFGNVADPSPLRHAWTLAIEEQFYVVVPILLGLLALLLRARWLRAGALLALAGLSAWRTAAMGLHDGADLTRLYYGTDTRVQALLVGAALGVLLVRRPTRWPAPNSWLLVVLGGLALAVTAVAFVVVGPFTGWMYNAGGILGLALVMALLVAAVADPGTPNALARLLGARPFAWAGRRSYALYLWHWPVQLVLGSLLDNPWLSGALGMVVTFTIAHLSWRYLERPVMVHGIRGLFPETKSPLLAAAMPVVILAILSTVVLRSTPTVEAVGTNAGSTETASTAPQSTAPSTPAGPRVIPDLVAGQAEPAAGGAGTLVLLGDSVPMHLAEAFPRADLPGTELKTFASEGCDLLTAPVSLGDGLLLANPDQCTADKQAWPDAARSADAVVYFVGPLLGAPHLVDERRIWLDDPAYVRLVETAFADLAERTEQAGATLWIVNAPCRQIDDAQIPDALKAAAAQFPEVRDELRRPDRLNAVVREFVDAHPTVRLVDLHGALCPSGTATQVVDGVPLWGDPLHFSAEGAPILWKWLLGQLGGRTPGSSP